MKRLFLFLIRFYQVNISPYKAYKCPYYPSCSAYGIQAVEEHGAFKGGLLTLWRILRCNPFSRGGVDPVPLKYKEIQHFGENLGGRRFVRNSTDAK